LASHESRARSVDVFIDNNYHRYKQRRCDFLDFGQMRLETARRGLETPVEWLYCEELR
jgi:hypothetical protein